MAAILGPPTPVGGFAGRGKGLHPLAWVASRIFLTHIWSWIASDRRCLGAEKSIKRWPARRKREVVLRLLRGERLDALSRETGQPAPVLPRWRDDFSGGGLEAAYGGPKVAGLEKEHRRAKRLVGDLNDGQGGARDEDRTV